VANMMKFLDRSIEEGWNVVGTALSDKAVSMEAVSVNGPTMIVLGNEGHGIRTNVLKRCTQLVKITGAVGGTGAHTDDSADAEILALGDGGVDSLNVSVTGGILLHHVISKVRLAAEK